MSSELSHTLQYALFDIQMGVALGLIPRPLHGYNSTVMLHGYYNMYSISPGVHGRCENHRGIHDHKLTLTRLYIRLVPQLLLRSSAMQ